MVCRYESVVVPCWKLEAEQRPSAADICTIISRMFISETGADYYYGSDIQQEVYENTNLGFQNEELYENNKPELPMYLDLKQ